MIVSGLKQCLYLFELNDVNTKFISVKKPNLNLVGSKRC